MLDEAVTHRAPVSAHMEVMVAIPAFNEEVAIGSVVLQALEFADEVVVIDDGSTDDTAEIAAAAGAFVIRHARNMGKGMAIRSAWLHARERQPRVLVVMDGDFQHRPADIPSFAIPILDDEVDVLLGVRSGRDSGMPLHRRAGNRMLDYITSLGRRNGMLTDSQCGFRGFSLRAIQQLEPGDVGLGIESQLLLDAQENELRIAEIDVGARYDVEGSTLSPVRHGVGVLAWLLALISERRPLFFFGVSGLTLLLLSVYLGSVVLRTFNVTGELAVGSSFLVLLFGIIGVLSLFTGILLNAFRRMLRRSGGIP